MTLPVQIWAPLEIALNRWLRLDPAAVARLSPLAGQVFALEFKGLGATLYLLVGESAIHVLSDYTGVPTTRLVGSPVALARLGLAGRGPAALPSDIEVHGSVESARRLQAALAEMDIDWEEQLANVVGDVAARPLANAARDFIQWGRAAVATLEQDVSEYLREEARLLPLRGEVEGFVRDVDTLRDDAARLSARVERLRRARS